MAAFSVIVLFLAMHMFIHEANAQWSLEGRPNPCAIMTDCAACMAQGPECIWCLEEHEKYGHCQPRSWNLCLRIEQSTAETHKVTVTKRRLLRPKRLISPQKIDLQLNKGASATIIFFVYSRKPNFEVSLRHSKVFDVTVESKCKGFKWNKKKASCKGIKPGKVEFRMVVKLRRCPKKNKKIKVMMEDNKRKRSLKIKVNSRCSCDCQKESEAKSARCNNEGSYVCGSCQCDAPFYGKGCECNPEDTNDMTCSAPGEEGVICSNRGECVCGACHCHSISMVTPYERYSGQYCECNDYSCDYYDGQICGGASRGRCVCGECQCFEGYSGTACQADLNTGTGGCLSVRTKSICNNVGVCVNNECQCIGNNRGPTCDDCLGAYGNCTSTCVGLKDCVDCFVFNSGRLSSGECYSKCAAVNSATELVDSVSIRERGGREFKMCMLPDDDYCLMKFAYDFSEDDRIQILAERKKMCPEF